MTAAGAMYTCLLIRGRFRVMLGSTPNSKWVVYNAGLEPAIDSSGSWFGSCLLGLIVFVIAAAIALGGALGVVMTRNIVYAAFSLLASLIGVAGLFLIAFAEFLALVQVLIYGGAIVIVILFALMLTRIQDFENLSGNRQWPIAGRRIRRSIRPSGRIGDLYDGKDRFRTGRPCHWRIWGERCSSSGPFPSRSRLWCCSWPLIGVVVMVGANGRRGVIELAHFQIVGGRDVRHRAVRRTFASERRS